ncbi:MAG: TRAP transporter small permease subunit [Ectothiorhodospiraceae bacterium]|nr:TRAP transporter small permease subunit [Ectothiorhodospiraceae bacterium]
MARIAPLESSSPVHRLAGLIDRVNERIGRAVSWLTLAMVLVVLVVVVMRYVFGLGSVWLQESIVYLHATVLMLAAGYTLLHDGHVRCDVLYARASRRRRAMVDLVGVLALLLPTCALVAWTSWPQVALAWSIREGSPEGALGIPAVWLLKSLLIAFPVLLGLQGVALAARALGVLVGDAGAGTASSAEPGR